MSMKRFVVSGHSMLPALKPGEEVVGSSSLDPSPGDVVAFPDPGHDNRWLIKRLADERGLVTSDNEYDSSRDSSDLGEIDVSSMMPVVTRLDEPRFLEAVGLLSSEDQALAGVVKKWGVPEFWERQPGFKTLVLLILEQQVSLESGAAMYRRLDELLDGTGPEQTLAAGPDALRGVGVTRQKVGYLLGLAEAVVSGDLDLTALEHVGVEEARARLTSLKGIGPWTADAYLLSASRRPDMWPVGDRALQVGAGEVVGMASAPNEDELEIVGEPWRPLRAVAARLIWHNYLSERGRTEPPDPIA